ncbi:hypothetical protein CKN73_13135 [Carnobacterium divergens]|uniref:IS3 family transposase n=1 Tax=Carnobacterium TaxID=2747 RepID=UPI000B7EA3F4|nr:transposase [Carnobacterium sp.]TFI86598.1 hypothetical protein CKN61_13305 [Carnobacterium divergens]UDE96394.1 transposase [Carnobacterium viridans]TFJ41968.1 hypothetical protein CKN77_04540 [Carnobacterium divergens]TFJ47344.1 hypothetical protein CKN73_13135 [Carnobacterium divergens]
MYGYPRLTILLNQKFSFNVSAGLIYRLMKELGIQSRMINRRKKRQVMIKSKLKMTPLYNFLSH